MVDGKKISLCKDCGKCCPQVEEHEQNGTKGLALFDDYGNGLFFTKEDLKEFFSSVEKFHAENPSVSTDAPIAFGEDEDEEHVLIILSWDNIVELKKIATELGYYSE